MLASIILLFGIVLIYDARIIAKKEFAFGNQNQATEGLKYMGFLFSIIGGLILFFNM